MTADFIARLTGCLLFVRLTFCTIQVELAGDQCKIRSSFFWFNNEEICSGPCNNLEFYNELFERIEDLNKSTQYFLFPTDLLDLVHVDQRESIGGVKHYAIPDCTADHKQDARTVPLFIKVFSYNSNLASFLRSKLSYFSESLALNEELDAMKSDYSALLDEIDQINISMKYASNSGQLDHKLRDVDIDVLSKELTEIERDLATLKANQVTKESRLKQFDDTFITQFQDYLPSILLQKQILSRLIQRI
jgi:hypothetical protein